MRLEGVEAAVGEKNGGEGLVVSLYVCGGEEVETLGCWALLDAGCGPDLFRLMQTVFERCFDEFFFYR